jgi:hypothetical protein
MSNNINTRSFIFVLIINMTLAFPGMVSASPTKNVALKLFGEGHAGVISPKIKTLMDNSGIDLTGFDCFELDVLDPVSEIKQGKGVDCLRPISVDGDIHGEGLQMEAITFFVLKHGMVVNHGCTSVRPFFEGIGDAGVTHMTGSIGPSEFGVEPSANSPIECTKPGIIYGTGSFKNVKGKARLSGAVNLSRAAEGILKFTCLFIVNLDDNRHQL